MGYPPFYEGIGTEKPQKIERRTKTLQIMNGTQKGWFLHLANWV